MQYPYQHIMLDKVSFCLQPTTEKLDPLLGQTVFSEDNEQLVKNSGHCIGSSLGAQSMMRACIRPNLVKCLACPPALIPVKAVEALLQRFSAAKKSMNRKNSKILLAWRFFAL